MVTTAASVTAEDVRRAMIGWPRCPVLPDECFDEDGCPNGSKYLECSKPCRCGAWIVRPGVGRSAAGGMTGHCANGHKVAITPAAHIVRELDEIEQQLVSTGGDLDRARIGWPRCPVCDDWAIARYHRGEAVWWCDQGHRPVKFLPGHSKWRRLSPDRVVGIRLPDSTPPSLNPRGYLPYADEHPHTVGVSI